MNDPKTISSRVMQILQRYPKARDDDMKLYFMVCKECYKQTANKDVDSLPFSTIMNNYRELKIPHFESVRRSRCKIQSEHPELRACEQVRKARKRKEYEYREYALFG
jgi:hypothetical protein